MTVSSCRDIPHTILLQRSGESDIKKRSEPIKRDTGKPPICKNVVLTYCQTSDLRGVFIQLHSRWWRFREYLSCTKCGWCRRRLERIVPRNCHRTRKSRLNVEPEDILINCAFVIRIWHIDTSKHRKRQWWLELVMRYVIACGLQTCGSKLGRFT